MVDDKPVIANIHTYSSEDDEKQTKTFRNDKTEETLSKFTREANLDNLFKLERAFKQECKKVNKNDPLSPTQGAFIRN